MELFNNMLDALESAYSKPLEDDEERLRSGELAPFSNERHAVIQVKGEKVVLRFFKDFAQKCIRALSGEMDALCEDVYAREHTIIADQLCNTLKPLVRGGSQRTVSRVATAKGGASRGPMIV